jgi:hypothetical protein
LAGTKDRPVLSYTGAPVASSGSLPASRPTPVRGCGKKREPRFRMELSGLFGVGCRPDEARNIQSANAAKFATTGCYSCVRAPSIETCECSQSDLMHSTESAITVYCAVGRGFRAGRGFMGNNN